ncbi:glycosyltransferase involved in cell wall biosynthesis [Methylohalomonas lacus]|uniref:Glycosyltransferase involved in cell wall biosynthesis n=1 Tax=Methylohalomonas lacus TaxID=398773 RepID=A0AAE3HNC6_9GAMM|nr:glycosyltransferase family A protein [Methylohalomonas lacus]MCS3904387.1 glycosyltransferase involved in cell wall biosynthesis [Methylohalomonas lacus]
MIVPVYNQWQLVPELLAHLKQQDFDSFELLLVDNGSTHIPDQPELPAFARLLHCSTPGSYAARNTGIENAGGQYLAFTDTDCRPSPYWLEYGLTCLREHDANKTIVGGAIEVIPSGDEPNHYERYDMVLGLRQAHYIDRGYATTANLFVAKALCESIGGFDASRFSGGDAEFCRRAGRQGIHVAYCQDALIRHPARDSWQAHVHKTRRIKGGQIRHGTLSSRVRFGVKILMPPVWAWRTILQNKQLTPGQQLHLCFIKARLWLVEIAELARLLAGGAPKRE